MKAYHGDPAIKDKYLARVRAHMAADELIHGTYWKDGKGCAVGCTIHGSDHMRYETEIGVPVMLARLEDAIFEGMDNGRASTWPADFLEAIQVGADLSRVGWQWLHWLLTESGIEGFNHPLVRDAVQQCAAVLLPLTRGEPTDKLAAKAAEAAWAAAAEAGWAAARAAAAAEASARAAAAAVAEVARAVAAARAAERAAAAAAEAAGWAVEAEEAEAGAWEKMAAQLLDLLRAAR